MNDLSNSEFPDIGEAGKAPIVPPEGNGHDPELIPWRDEMMRFVNILFKRVVNRKGYIAFRVFSDDGSKDAALLVSTSWLDDPEFAKLMMTAAHFAANCPNPAVFATPVCIFRSAKNAKTDNLLEGPVLSVECDQAPEQAREELEALLGPATIVVESGGEWICEQTGLVEDKLHLYWRLTKPACTVEELAMLYAARALAAQIVGADRTNISIVHPIRWPGSWHRKGPPRLAKIAGGEEDAEIDLREALGRLREATGIMDPPPASGPTDAGSHEAAHPSAIAQAMAVIPNDSTLRNEKGELVHDWEYWNWTGMTIWRASGGSEDGRLVFHEWSAKAKACNQAETEKRWRHYFRSPPKRLGFGSLVFRAREASPGWRYENPIDPAIAEAVAEFIAQLLREKEEPEDEADEADSTASTRTASSPSEPIEPVDLWAKFEPPPLPRGLLPPVLEEFAFDRGTLMGNDMSGVAMGALVVCAASIPQDISLQPKRNDPDWQESARLWVALVGSISVKKTPTLNTVAKPLREIDNEMAHKYQKALGEWRKLPAEERAMSPRPRHLRARLMDTTVEAAQDILSDSPDGVMLDQDELSGWFGAMEKYTGSKGAAADRAFWMKAYDGVPYAVDRVTRGYVYIPALSVSILGGIQPKPIRVIASGGEDDGLLQRFNPIVMRPSVVGRDEAPSHVVFDYSGLIKKLRKLRPPRSGYLHPPTTVLKFDDGALKIREELERKHLELEQLSSLNQKLAFHIGKYNGQFVRLCVIWHCVEHVNDAELPAIVTENTAQRVANFMHSFLLPHALAFYAGVLGLANDHDVMADVAGYILARKLTVITSRGVQQGTRAMRKLAQRETNELFEQLEAFGWLTKTPGPKTNSLPRWVVNPAVHQKFEVRAKDEKERREREREMIIRMAKGVPT